MPFLYISVLPSNNFSEKGWIVMSKRTRKVLSVLMTLMMLFA